jgi:hypothetical protein
MALSWPFGVAWTAWHYLWRILPLHRREMPGTPGSDLPPALPPEISQDGVQAPADGSGPLFHRIYTARIRGSGLGPAELIGRLAADPNTVSPSRLARFRKTNGDEGGMKVGDEYVVHMPGPWNGPIRVVAVEPCGFRFATLEGHLEAGQIEWRAWHDDDLHFVVESWSRGGDRASAILHDRIGMAKEVQLYMWTSILQRVAREAGGRLVEGVDVETRRVPPEVFDREHA